MADVSKEKTKGVVLRRAEDPCSQRKRLMPCLEKRPLIPQWTGNLRRSRQKGVDDDPYAKAPHGDSDDEEDLEAELRSLGGLPTTETLQ